MRNSEIEIFTKETYIMIIRCNMFDRYDEAQDGV
jgi:hypothetical protein